MRTFGPALFALIFMACATSPANAEWVSYSSKTYGFTALFPKTPTADSDKHVTTVASKDYIFETHQFTGRGANGSLCIVAHSLETWPMVVDEQLATNRDSMASNIGATVTTSKRTTLARGASAVPALLFDAAGADYAFRTLEVIDGQSAYEVVAGVPIGNSDDSDLDRCIKGFSLTAK